MAEKKGRENKGPAGAKDRGKKATPARARTTTKGKPPAAEGGTVKRASTTIRALSGEYEDVDGWVGRLVGNPQAATGPLADWERAARIGHQLAPRGLEPGPACRRLTVILIGWCMHRKGPHVDPAPLLELLAAWRDTRGGGQHDTAAAYRRAMATTALLKTYAAVNGAGGVEAAVESSCEPDDRMDISTPDACWLTALRTRASIMRLIRERGDISKGKTRGLVPHPRDGRSRPPEGFILYRRHRSQDELRELDARRARRK